MLECACVRVLVCWPSCWNQTLVLKCFHVCVIFMYTTVNSIDNNNVI